VGMGRRSFTLTIEVLGLKIHGLLVGRHPAGREP
jgi:hypothetical protein